jgi:ABC-type transporter Mla subunit MlaD
MWIRLRHPKDDTLRAQYRARLEEIAEYGKDQMSESAPLAAEGDGGDLPALSFAVEPAPQSATDGQTANLQLTAPATDPEPTPDVSSDEFRQLAKRIAANCTEALAEAIGGRHWLASEDREKLEATVGGVAALSGEIRRLDDELTSLRQGAGRLTEAECAQSDEVAGIMTRLCEGEAASRRMAEDLQRLSAVQEHDRTNQALAGPAYEDRLRQLEQHLGKLEGLIEKQAAGAMEKVSEVSERLEAVAQAIEAQADKAAGLNSALSRLQETQQTVQRRLDMQTEAIRKLHTTEQERRTQFQVTLQKIKEMEVVHLLPLPERL